MPRLVTREQRPLPPHSNAIDASIHIASGIVTDRSTRNGAGVEHHACPRHATRRVAYVSAVNDCARRFITKRDTRKPQQDTGGNSCNC